VVFEGVRQAAVFDALRLFKRGAELEKGEGGGV